MFRRPLTLVPMLAALLLAACSYPGLFKAPVPLNDQFQSITAYEFGQSRATLTVIESQVHTVEPDSAAAAQLRGQLVAMLASDATLDAKRFALRNLALLGQTEDIPAIAPLLLDEDLSDMARYALRPLKAPAADAALRKALRKAETNQKIGIINTLGQRRDQNALWAIGRQLDSPEPGVSRAAIMALGKIGDAKALKKLQTHMATAPESLQSVYADACLSAADSLLDAGDTHAAIGGYRTLFESAQPKHLRIAAFRGLVMASGPDADALIIDQIQGDDPALKQIALVLVREVPGEDFTQAVASQLENIEPELQVTLLQILSQRGDKAALPQIVEATHSADDGVRQEALRALGKLGDASSVKLLAKTAATAKGKDQLAARESLTRLTGRKINAELIAQLNNAPAEDVALRREYIRALGNRHAMESVPALLTTAAAPQPKVRVEAYKALAMIADENAVPGLVDLIKALQGKNGRKDAEAALIAAATRSAAARPTQASFIVKHLEGASSTACGSLLRVLGGMGDPAGLPAIQKALACKEAPLVDAAVRALADWPTPDPTDQLIGIARTSSEQTHQVLAMRGYLRMAGQTAASSPPEALAMYQQALSVIKRPEEKKLVLGGLGAVGDPAGFALIKPMLGDKALRQEAQVAQVKLAARLAIANPGSARQAINEVLAMDDADSLAKEARGVLSLIERYDDYIRAWQAAGPFTAKGVGASDQLDYAFAPESDPDSVEWKTLGDGPTTVDSWRVDFKALYAVNNHAAYVRTNVWSPKAQRVRVELGSDDGVKVWINGQVVHLNNVARGLEAASDKLEVELNEGWNTLKVKVSNGGGDWGTALRLRTLEGGHLDGLKIQAQR